MVAQDMDLDGLRQTVHLLELLKGIPELLCLLLVGVVVELLLVADGHHLPNSGEVADEEVSVLPQVVAEKNQLLLPDHLGDGFASEVIPWSSPPLEGEVLEELGHLIWEEGLHDPEAVVGNAELDVERHWDIQLQDGGVVLGSGENIQRRVFAREVVPNK